MQENCYKKMRNVPYLDLEPWQQGSFRFETPLPGSKSLTLRDCAIAALADGTSTIRYPGECDDYWRMKDCLRRLGFTVDDSREDVVHITGRGGEFAPGEIALDVGQSAVTTRLLLALASLRPSATVIDGHISMQKRPNKDLVDALRALGAALESTNDGYLPTRVTGTRALKGPARVAGTISSQYLTSLLTIAPLIDGGLTIEVEGDLTSKPYVDLTLDEMAKFGVVVENHGYRRLVVAPQAYRASTIDVEGDASGASYFAALAVLHGATITLTNLGTRTRQGDYAFFGLCEQLGAHEASARYADIDAELARRQADLDGMLAFVTKANEPTVMDQGGFERLMEIAQLRYLAGSGESRPFLERAEIAALQVRRGSLTDAERVEIESHVVHTYNFLTRIPWGRTLRNIPRIAGAHHEYLNGNGYPGHLQQAQIPLESRMMTIADIFDALTASDRPYKKAVPVDRALGIVEGEVKAGKLDAQLFELFVSGEIYKAVL